MKKTILFLSLFFCLGLGSVVAGTFYEVSLQNPNTELTSIRAYLSGTSLIVKNVPDGTTVEIYSAIGSRVQVSTLKEGVVDVSNLSKGLYIVRIGKFNQKLMIQ